jgi:nucleoside-diphosphate-sugar epimerase/predicted dehydrogenase
MDFQAALDRAGDLGVQAVFVALPNALHEHAVSSALERGFDVLCEKPLALTHAACQRLGDVAAHAGRVLGVGMTRRYLPSVKSLQRVLDAGWIGEIESIDAEDGYDFSWSSESGQYGRPGNAGVLANLGVHTLDLVDHLCGPLTPVAYADDWRGGVEANATFELRTSKGTPVRLAFSYTHTLAKGFRIRGTRGEGRITADPHRAWYLANDGDMAAEISLARPFQFGRWPPTFESSFSEQFCDFCAAVAHRRAPRVTAHEAARTAGLIDWAYAHHEAERRSRQLVVSVAAPPVQPGRIVVTGGTGFVGGHLIQALCDRGQTDILVPIRGYQHGANAWRFPVQLQMADLLDRSSVRAVMSGARYVFHLAYGRDGGNAARVTVEGTENVVEAAVEAGAECVVVISTTAVFGDPDAAGPVDESFPYAPPRREYETTKAEAERWALARARRETRTRIVVVNPSCVYGPGGKTFTELPARLLRDGSFCWIEGGRGVVNYVYAGNLADAMLLAASSPEAHGERFIVSDGSVTWRQFFAELFGSAVTDLPSYTRAELAAFARERVPSLRDVARSVVGNEELWSLVRAHPRLASTKEMLGRMSPRLYQRVKDSRQRSRSPVDAPDRPTRPPLFIDELFGVTTARLSAAKAHRVLGWTPAIDLAAGQAASRAWLAEIGLADVATPRRRHA